MKYKVEWPLSVVVSKKALTKYQLMFRHLFFVKHVERQLLATWQDHQVTNMFNYLQFNLRVRFVIALAVKGQLCACVCIAREKSFVLDVTAMYNYLQFLNYLKALYVHRVQPCACMCIAYASLRIFGR
jgi:Gamma tubulin complex component C-terminal